ncbi:hypothetical protein [Pedobacter sp. L105]|uniref:hypothetical protein n=1 Tax=Pedobacter sp. L105 TaxID=1641871 RepID=UPI00131ED10D|nr:hypothetical protein [Pedobacter sp. L105]
MKNQTHSFWTGVINYVRASAQSAEALKPWDFRTEKESKTVLVFRTSVEEYSDQSPLFIQLNELIGANNWTIDLEDVDKVLRAICVESSRDEIVTLLQQQGYLCEVLL